jgi:hypothetical protein
MMIYVRLYGSRKRQFISIDWSCKKKVWLLSYATPEGHGWRHLPIVGEFRTKAEAQKRKTEILRGEVASS